LLNHWSTFIHIKIVQQIFSYKCWQMIWHVALVKVSDKCTWQNSLATWPSRHLTRVFHTLFTPYWIAIPHFHSVDIMEWYIMGKVLMY
jgi:hypothetical protein